MGISFAELFENLGTTATENSAASECYDLVDALKPEEQRAMLEIIKRTIAFKGL